MNPEIKRQWLAALRSGKYEQITHRLAADGGFCCLGVLCEILPDNSKEKIGESRELYAYFSHSSTLPPEIQNRAEIPDGVSGTLSTMNDDQRKTFPEIADWIEANL